MNYNTHLGYPLTINGITFTASEVERMLAETEAAKRQQVYLKHETLFDAAGFITTAGNKILAIKLVRSQIKDLGLMEAKILVENYPSKYQKDSDGRMRWVGNSLATIG